MYSSARAALKKSSTKTNGSSACHPATPSKPGFGIHNLRATGNKTAATSDDEATYISSSPNSTPTSSPDRSVRSVSEETTFWAENVSSAGKEILGSLQSLRDLQILHDGVTTPRDNNLMQGLLLASSVSPRVTHIKVVDDPRFAHVTSSVLLDFADSLKYNIYLESLVFKDVELGNGFLSRLAESLPTNHTLKVLNLSNNCLTSDALVEFCLSMANNRALQNVDLRNQNSPISSSQEEAVIEALSKNDTITTFHIDFRSKECAVKLKSILRKNAVKQGGSSKADEKAFLAFLKTEVKLARAELEALSAFDVEMVDGNLQEKDLEYFQALNKLATKYNVDLLSAGTTEKNPEKTQPAVESIFSKSSIAKTLNFSLEKMTADGSFLDHDFVSSYLRNDAKTGTLTFEFTNQFKVFKRFCQTDPLRPMITRKFVEALTTHPKAGNINILNMANTCIGDDVLERLCQECRTNKAMANVHQLNIETNFISGSGLVALGDLLSAVDPVWPFLTVLRMDNQRSPTTTAAELSLAKGLCLNRSVIRFSLRVRNLACRDKINRSVQRNIDFLRQARQLYARKSGATKTRPRNKVETLFDRISANDPDIKSVELVGDQIFLSLNDAEKLKAAASFAKNTHVTKITMSVLKLNNAFGVEFGKSIQTNDALKSVIFDNNCIGSDGMVAILQGMSVNKSIEELQLRHQSKPVASSDEEMIMSGLSKNEKVVKLGIDIRGTLVKNQIDRHLLSNQDKKRRAGRGAKTNTA